MSTEAFPLADIDTTTQRVRCQRCGESRPVPAVGRHAETER